MVNEMSRKPYFQPRKWKLGNSFGWVNVPYCPHCNRQLGTLAQEQKINECPMCKKPLDWQVKAMSNKKHSANEGLFVSELKGIKEYDR